MSEGGPAVLLRVREGRSSLKPCGQGREKKRPPFVGEPPEKVLPNVDNLDPKGIKNATQKMGGTAWETRV